MQIRIDKQSEVPVHDQLRQQIIFLIGTGQLSIGTALPSVRELARRLKIHHNTVSHVYSQLADEGWLIKKHGSRLIVGRQVTNSAIEEFASLDDLINQAIRLARSRGYSLQQLTHRVRRRLLAEPSDHLLLVAPEREIGELMRAEIGDAIGQEPDACSVSMLLQNPSIGIGALLVTPSYFVDRVEKAGLADRMVVPLTYSPADQHLAAIGALTHASVVGVASVSALFLETANGVLAPAIGSRHSFREFLLFPATSSAIDKARFMSYIAAENTPDITGTWAIPDKLFAEKTRTQGVGNGTIPASQWLSFTDLAAVDLLFCDSVAYGRVQHKRKVKYRLLSEESIAEIKSAAKSILSREPTTS